jgi:crotonobetainyl-CoA:carnitine CoA-transferase CaiB-like acyl-CoA transferase
MKNGPLSGLKILEFVGIGPGPLAAMILSDLGADVLRIDRVVAGNLGVPRPVAFDFGGRGRPSLALDLKRPESIDLVLDLVGRSDGLIEGFRPGVMERLGLGPDVCLKAKPDLAYGRLTGWGQTGPMAPLAGHDLNYIALTGALDMIGRSDSGPVPPLNIIGDYAGGSLLMVIGILAAIHSARQTGRGQVIDSAIVDGVALMMTPLLGMMASGSFNRGRGRNILDSGAPHYDTYICSDGLYLAVAPIEEKFRVLLLEGLGLDPATFPDVTDPANWAKARPILAARIATRPRDEWAAIFAESDACVAPVLSAEESRSHPHLVERGVYVKVGEHLQPAPAPRFSATPCDVPTPTVARGSSAEALTGWGVSLGQVETLRRAGALL